MKGILSGRSQPPNISIKVERRIQLYMQYLEDFLRKLPNPNYCQTSPRVTTAAIYIVVPSDISITIQEKAIKATSVLLTLHEAAVGA